MPIYTHIAPQDRTYCDNYRYQLEPFEAQLVEVKGTIKLTKIHPKRPELNNVLLVDVVIKPMNAKVFTIPHLWALERNLIKLGISVEVYKRVSFIGSVYSYHRLGGLSQDRGIKQTHDFSILPMSSTEVEGFTPGLDNRYKQL